MEARVLVALAALWLAAAPARAESALALPRPDPLGRFEGVVVARDGRAIGVNVVDNLARDDGLVYLRSESRVDGVPDNLLEAELEPAPGNPARLRPVWQHTQMPARSGAMLDLEVDHRAGRARCRLDGGEAREIALAEGETIANVAMNLALRPLAAGEVDTVRFQLLLCEGWKQVVDVVAHVVRTRDGAPVEMKLSFDLGSSVLSALFAPFLPDIHVWMRREPPNEWVAHRLPLHRGGPIVAIVRAGIDPAPYLP